MSDDLPETIDQTKPLVPYVTNYTNKTLTVVPLLPERVNDFETPGVMRLASERV